MVRTDIRPTGIERFFSEDDIIVSKTNLKGEMTYVNDIFMEIAGYEEHELIGVQHNLIRHPDMPRCVFNLLWDTIASGKEIFAYVINMCKNGDHYWVFAHVTPTFDDNNNIISYHSNRRVPERKSVELIKPIYAALLAEEKKQANKREEVQASTQVLVDTLENQGVSYDEFVFSI